MPKVLKCADVMGDCNTVIVGKDADEVFAKSRSARPQGTQHDDHHAERHVADRGGHQGPLTGRQQARTFCTSALVE